MVEEFDDRPASEPVPVEEPKTLPGLSSTRDDTH
jgi:hypothetical protein